LKGVKGPSGRGFRQVWSIPGGGREGAAAKNTHKNAKWERESRRMASYYEAMKCNRKKLKNNQNRTHLVLLRGGRKFPAFRKEKELKERGGGGIIEGLHLGGQFLGMAEGEGSK